MKRIFTILAFTISLSICHAQETVYLVSNPNTARWSYIETDSNGKMTATIFNSVESITGDAVNGNIKMLVEEVPVASPKDTVRSFVYYRFKDGEYPVMVCLWYRSGERSYLRQERKTGLDYDPE